MNQHQDEWLSVREAAALMGYSADYFRRTFCSTEAPLVTIRVWVGAKGQRRILVARAGVERVIEDQTTTSKETAQAKLISSPSAALRAPSAEAAFGPPGAGWRRAPR
jgi:hypothetical protein